MVRKYVGKVEHFLVAGREVDVFLGIASLAATEFGVVTCMYTAENGYKYGFAGATPGILMALAMFFVGVTGFCINPLRHAGAITIPELFEKRFGPRVRWAAGVVIVLGGLLNMGVFLRITGEFLVLVSGFELAHLERNLLLMMTVLLLLGTIYTVVGGMLSVLVTEFLQFLVMSTGLLAVTLLILVKIGWDPLVATVAEHHGDGGFNPFVCQGMGWPYVVFNALECLAGALTWQTMISRVLASKDVRTGRRIYTRTSFFFACRFVLPGIWGIAALAWLAPGAFAGLPSAFQQNKALYAMPLFLSGFVPVGLMGLLLAAMLAASMSCTSSYMMTWASVIYNDIVTPLRKTLWSERRGLLWNRMIVSLIGAFLLFYGLWYPLQGDVYAYLLVTGTIYMASISTMLVACCYWKRANNWGATAAIVVGAVIPIACLVFEQVRKMSPDEVQLWRCYSGIGAFAATALAMVVFSLLKPQSDVSPPGQSVEGS
jgi:SSS family solute:Na+ symporter